MATFVSSPSPSHLASSTSSPRSAHRPPLPFQPSSPFRLSKTSTPSPSSSPSPHHAHPPPPSAASSPYTPSVSAPPPTSPSVEGSAVPQYLRELAIASQQRTRFLSREPSLPSIMSMPRSRPTSPSASTSLDLHPLPLSPQHPQTTTPGGPGRGRRGSMSNPAHAYRAGLGLQVSSGVGSEAGHPQQPSAAGRGRASNAPASLRAFEEGVGHYERVRSPSLRGHSRRGSWSSVDPLAQSISSLRRDAPTVPTPAVERGWSGVWSLGEEEEEARLEECQLGPDWLGDETIREAPHLQSNGLTGSDWTHELVDGDDTGVWEIGERLGVGTLHQGALVRDLFPHSDSAAAPLLEVVRQVGVGSYAVVYLVQEVLYDPYLGDTTRSSALAVAGQLGDPHSSTPRASLSYLNSSSNLHVSHGTRGPGQEREGEGSQVVYGRDFALKCLCKRDLSEEQLVLQRGEAELHRALPLHPNIVALHRALETPNWLFLVIEYCPGQDLFYWLEQARDSENLDFFASRTNSFSPHFPPLHSQHHSSRTPAEQHTPPSPSLLAAKADDEMLSRRRIRLISRMFAQMCDSVQACHAVGVCHRDIKPENFIVVDERVQSSTRSDRHSPQQQAVTVKITDWGLGTHLAACDDFDCGSKPYMAYECRNNLHPTYDPVQADVWSLGIVLLNLLYHRCPWADPVLSDPDFKAFRAQPVAFLLNRFEGMTEAVAMFLASRVFCEVNESIGLQRVTAGQFGMWTRDLLHHLGGGQAQASASEATIPMSPSSARGSSSPARMPLLLDTSHRPSSTLAHSIRVPNSPLATVPDAVTPDVSTPPSSAQHDRLKLASPQSTLPPVVAVPEGSSLQEEEDSQHSPTAEPAMSDAGTSERHRRRKRGARKGKRDGQRNGAETAPVSPSLRPLDSRDVLHDMAQASQSLAREISRTTKTSPTLTATTQSHQPFNNKSSKPKHKQSMNWRERFTTGGHAGLNQLLADKKAREAAMYGGDIVSAPAKLQQPHLASSASQITTESSSIQSTISSLGTSSWGSYSVKDDEPVSRGRSGERHLWASTSRGKERLHVSPGGHGSGASDLGNTPLTTISSRESELSCPSTPDRYGGQRGDIQHVAATSPSSSSFPLSPPLEQRMPRTPVGAGSARAEAAPSPSSTSPDPQPPALLGYCGLDPISEKKPMAYRHPRLGGGTASTVKLDANPNMHAGSGGLSNVVNPNPIIVLPTLAARLGAISTNPHPPAASLSSKQPPVPSAVPTIPTLTHPPPVTVNALSKVEGKTKLASLLTSFKRFNQSVGHSGPDR